MNSVVQSESDMSTESSVLTNLTMSLLFAAQLLSLSIRRGFFATMGNFCVEWKRILRKSVISNFSFMFCHRIRYDSCGNEDRCSVLSSDPFWQGCCLITSTSFKLQRLSGDHSQHRLFCSSNSIRLASMSMFWTPIYHTLFPNEVSE